MAVSSVLRGRKYGSALFSESARIAQQTSKIGRLIFELDSDREDAADIIQRQQRLKFYNRLGCKRVEGLQYILLLETTEKPPLMDLLVYQLSNDNFG